MSEVTAGLMHDRMTSRAWLTFPKRPPQEVIDDLNTKGWRWSSLRDAYNHPSMVTRKDPRMPVGVTVQYDGLCDYNAERADLLEARSNKRAAESRSKFDTAHKALDGIPPGQPVLVGHHSEKRHRATLRRHDENMSKGVELAKDAARLHSAASGSRQRREERMDPVTARNRLARLTEELERARANGRDDVVEVLELLVEDTRTAAEQPIAADTLDPKPGDIVFCGGLELVVSVNKKTLNTVCLSEGNAWGWESQPDRRKLQKILSRGNPLPTWTAWRQKNASEGGGLENCGHSDHKSRAAANKCSKEKWPEARSWQTHPSMVMPDALKGIVKALLDNLRNTPKEAA